MKYSFSNIFIGLVFAALLFGSGLMQSELKHDVQIIILLFGILTLASLFAKLRFKTSIPFYILLGVLLYVNIFILTNQILNFIYPDDGLVVDSSGERHSVMQMNWIWAGLVGLVLSPTAVVLYHKKISRNRFLEISLTLAFIVLTTVIYVNRLL